MFPYIPNTDKDERAMLDVIGAESLDDLFKDIPESLHLKRDLKIGKPMSELEVRRALTTLAGMNKSADTKES